TVPNELLNVEVIVAVPAPDLRSRPALVLLIVPAERPPVFCRSMRPPGRFVMPPPLRVQLAVLLWAIVPRLSMEPLLIAPPVQPDRLTTPAGPMGRGAAPALMLPPAHLKSE